MAQYLKEYELLAEPFDKRNGFFVMKKTTYQSKLNKLHYCPQISEVETTNDKIIVQIEKDVNGALLEMKNKTSLRKKFDKN